MKYYVVTVRKTKGVEFTERAFDDASSSEEFALSLGADTDCLLAEVQGWSNEGDDFNKVILIAQFSRQDGKWTATAGELRIKTRGAEAKSILTAEGYGTE